MSVRAGLMLAAVGLALAGQEAAAEPVALTFDDLPSLALPDQPGYARVTTQRLLQGLKRHRFPAIGFVVGDKYEDTPAARDALLRLWLRAGFELGNHTYSHSSLNNTGAAAYVSDVARDDALLRRIQPAAPRWFRHPYLETGATAADKGAVETWLTAHGYRIAPVTLEASDDVFAYPYDQAVLSGDRRRAAEVKAAYLAYTDRSIAWYREAAFTLFGRRPPLVYLLHATRLNADSLDELAAMLRRHDLHPAPLDRVMADPVYSLPDGPPTKDGDEWLTRWAGVLGRELPWDSFPEPPAEIVAETEKLDVAP